MHTLAVLIFAWVVLIPTTVVVAAWIGARRRERLATRAAQGQAGVTLLQVAPQPNSRSRASESCASRARPLVHHGLAPRR